MGNINFIWEKLRRIVTLGGNRERAMESGSPPRTWGGLASMFVSQVAGSLCRSSFNESQQEFPSTTNSSFNQITAYEIKLSKDNHPFSYPNAIC